MLPVSVKRMSENDLQSERLEGLLWSEFKGQAISGP